jgi:hypothetical protein
VRLTLAFLMGVAALGCEGNRPGPIRIVNNYTGPCPLSVKTSEARGISPARETLAPGQNLLPEERAGLLRVDLQTGGFNCGAEPCTLGPAGFDTSCIVFTAAGYPQKITVENRLDGRGCVQPEVICPVGADIDASVKSVVPDRPILPSGTWSVKMAEPASGNGSVMPTSSVLADTPGADSPTGIVVAEGTVGTVRHILKVEWKRATDTVASVSHSWRQADGTVEAVVLCSETPPWPVCVGVTVDPGQKRIRLTGTALANPISGTERSIVDADLSYR